MVDNDSFELVECAMLRMAYEDVRGVTGPLDEGKLFIVAVGPTVEESRPIVVVIHKMFDDSMLVYPMGSGNIEVAELK